MLQLRDWVEGGGENPNLAKVTTFEILLTFRWGISRKKLKLLKFSSNFFFIKSHTMIVKTLSERKFMVILHFRVENVVFEHKQSQNCRSFTESRVLVQRTSSLKISLRAKSYNFSWLYVKRKFKIQRNKSERCKTVFGEYSEKQLSEFHLGDHISPYFSIIVIDVLKHFARFFLF